MHELDAINSCASCFYFISFTQKQKHKNQPTSPSSPWMLDYKLIEKLQHWQKKRATTATKTKIKVRSWKRSHRAWAWYWIKRKLKKKEQKIATAMYTYRMCIMLWIQGPFFHAAGEHCFTNCFFFLHFPFIIVSIIHHMHSPALAPPYTQMCNKLMRLLAQK